MDKPIVLFLIDGLQVGGAERSLLETARRLIHFSPVVCVLSDSLALLPEFQKSEIRVISFPLPRNYRFANNAKRLLKLVREIQPDLIHSFLFHSDMILRYLPVIIPKITGLVSNSYAPRRLNQLSWKVRLKVKILKLWDKSTAKNIDLFISNSQVIKTAYSNQLGIPAYKIKVIPRGRDLGRFGKLRKEHSATKTFISVGRLIPSKGFDELVRAFAELRKKHPDIKLIIAGEGPERFRLEQVIQSFGLTNSVILPGTIQNIEDLYSSADFFVFPTHYEGLPGALIEAMMARIPIICSDIPENKECVDDSRVLFHRVGDQTDLLDKMDKALVLEDWDFRTQGAYDYAAEHFEIGRIVEEYENTYLTLLKTKNSF